MKKYLEDLKKELKKLKVNEQEIAEILADHKEMIEAAHEDGVSDEDLVSKFGNPDKVAKDLYKDAFTNSIRTERGPLITEGELEGFSLIKAFPVIEGINNVNISLISEDLRFFPYEGQTIEVYGKKIKNVEDYTITFVDNDFNLSRNSMSKKLNFFGINSHDGDFVVKVPLGIDYNKIAIKGISSDMEIDTIKTNEIKVITTSGDFELSNFSVEGTFDVSSVSGDFEFDSLEAKQLDISLVSGDIEIQNCKIVEEFKVNTVSGDVEVKNLQATNVSFRTVSGDFEGNEVYIDTVEIKSVSGDFEISNSIHDHEITVTSKKTLSGDVTIK